MPGIPKIAQAKQLLVRYIHEHHLRIGDRLPAQETFRRAFKFGTTTINAAITELKREGILEVRDKVGVYVVDPSADGHTCYTIALVAWHNGHNLFYSSLLTTLQHKLSSCGYTVRLFSPVAYKENTIKSFFELDDFPGLRRHLEARTVNAVIHMDDFTPSGLEFMRSRNIPAIFIGSIGCSIAPNGIFFDTETSISNACARIMQFAPSRLALACHHTVMENCRRAMEKFFPGRTLYFPCSGSPDGIRFAASILAMPREQRPDWLMLPDDIVALAATARLAQALPQEEIPHCVIFSTLRFQLFYPVNNAIYFDSSLDECVAAAVSLLRKSFSENTLDPGKVLFVHREAASSAE